VVYIFFFTWDDTRQITRSESLKFQVPSSEFYKIIIIIIIFIIKLKYSFQVNGLKMQRLYTSGLHIIKCPNRSTEMQSHLYEVRTGVLNTVKINSRF